MKRTSYVDSQGNTIDQNFESKKPLLTIFFIIGTVLPIILIGIIIYTVIQNNSCNKIYTNIESATLQYLKEEEKIPKVEGEDTTVSLSKLYNKHYLNTYQTQNMTCQGTVKTTKYKKDYVYTLNLTNCNTCTTTTRYGAWSNELNYFPKNKPIVDVIPYYNYYERQVVTTDWSKYYEKDEISQEKSKYGNLPTEDNMQNMPEVPEEGNIIEVEKEETIYYRYQDKRWKWYDIIGNYSDLSSEQPSGFSTKDENTKTYTEWSEYSLTYPEEKEYREIHKTTGYQFYYEDENGKKIYANNKNYTAQDDIDQTKYNKRENKIVEMYRYRDAKWRWYSGQRRKYSSYYSEKPKDYNYRDNDLFTESSYSSWSEESKLTLANQEYRTEEEKTMTRFRYLYEILSDPVLEKPVNKSEFTEIIGMKVPEFVTDEEYKMEVTYKFKYRKR